MIRRGTEEGAEHVDDFRSLKGGSLGEGGEDGDVLRAGHAAGSHADFSKDDERAQSAFGVVVGGGSSVFDEGELAVGGVKFLHIAQMRHARTPPPKSDRQATLKRSCDCGLRNGVSRPGWVFPRVDECYAGAREPLHWHRSTIN